MYDVRYDRKVPLALGRRSRRGGVPKYPFREMRIGGYFEIEWALETDRHGKLSTAQKVTAAVRQAAAAFTHSSADFANWAFRTEIPEDDRDVVRVWRVEDAEPMMAPAAAAASGVKANGVNNAATKEIA